MQHSAKGPFYVKKKFKKGGRGGGGGGRKTGRQGFFDMFREPDNVLHATPAFPKPSLAHREYFLVS